MNELLRKRIDRHLENLSDQQGYQLLDFVEFLESKYGTGSRPPSTFERVSEGVEDAMRAGRLPATAIREAMKAMDSASRLMQRLAEAGKSAVEELDKSLAETERAARAAADGESATRADDTPAAEPDVEIVSDDDEGPPASA